MLAAVRGRVCRVAAAGSGTGGSLMRPGHHLCNIHHLHQLQQQQQQQQLQHHPPPWPAQQRGSVRCSSSQKNDLARSSHRAMPIKLVTVSKANSQAAQAMAKEWIDKLSRYTSCSEVVIRPNPKGSSSPKVQKDAEAEKVLKAIAPGDRVVLLDERGREVSSEDVARLLANAGENSTPLAFVIGGPFGHGQAVLQRADDTIRLSKLVLNHQVAYVVLVEALYRGWAILKGEPYHH